MSLREVGVLLAMCVIWGFHIIVIKVAVDAMPPFFYAAIRMTLVAALLSPFLRWRPGHMAPVLSAGLCLGALNYALMFTGLQYATASAGAVAMELYVPFATVLSVIFLGENIGWRRIAGISLAFAGVALIATGKPEAVPAGSRFGLGIGLLATAALVEAVGAILVKKAKGFSPFQLLSWFAVVGAISLSSLTAVFETDHAGVLAEVNGWFLVSAILYSAIGGSIIGHASYYWLLQRLPVSVVAPSVLLTTFLAVIFGVVLLKEPFGPRMIAGGVMVIAGVGFILLRNARKTPNAAAIETPVET